MEKRYIPLIVMLGFFIILIFTTLIAGLLGVPIIALDDTLISIATFDFYTLAHLLWGVAIFVLIFTIGFIVKNLSDDEHAPIKPPGFKKLVIFWVITLVVAVIWEILENTLLLFVGMKIHFDSPSNIITDITIWGIGGLLSWYMTDLMFLSHKYIRAYYIYGLLNLLSGVALFVLLAFM